MVEFEYIISNPVGLHMRPAGCISKYASKCESKIYLKYENNVIDAKSILKIVTLGITHGKKVVFQIDGRNEEKVLVELKKLIYDADV